MTMGRQYSSDILTRLAHGAVTCEEDGISIIYKPIPEGAPPGTPDPRLLKQMRAKVHLASLLRCLPRRQADPLEQVLKLRKAFNTVKSLRITSTHVTVEHHVVESSGYRVPVRVYRPLVREDNPIPVLYYIHGGGFFAGSPDVVEEMCQLVVAREGCAAVSIDYRLAPENPYPTGHQDCYRVLNWIGENALMFGADPNRIMVGGDSAGGNLALYCCARAKADNLPLVKALALIYPTVNMAGKADAFFDPHQDIIHIDPRHERFIRGLLAMMAGSGENLAKVLGSKADVNSPYLSPYLGDLTGYPPTILLVGEFDFLYPECRAMARKLDHCGVITRTIVYRGLTHGFADCIGGYPQAEDCMIEIGTFMEEYV